jgi:hypothetical protein
MGYGRVVLRIAIEYPSCGAVGQCCTRTYYVLHYLLSNLAKYKEAKVSTKRTTWRAAHRRSREPTRFRGRRVARSGKATEAQRWP